MGVALAGGFLKLCQTGFLPLSITPNLPIENMDQCTVKSIDR